MSDLAHSGPKGAVIPGGGKSRVAGRLPTDAQFWILCRAVQGAAVVRTGGYAVYQSLAGKPTYYGGPAAAHDACVRLGWLSDNHITVEGRAAYEAVIERLESDPARRSSTTPSPTPHGDEGAAEVQNKNQPTGGE